MMKLEIVTRCVALVLVCGGIAVAAEAPPTLLADKLGPAAAKQWEAAGAVRWDARGGVLGADGTLSRPVAADEPAWFSFVLEPLDAEAAVCATWLELVYDDGGRDRLSVGRESADGRATCRVRVTCERPSGGPQPARRDIFDRRYDAAWAAGRWELRWQRGTLTPVRDGQSLATCVPNVNFFPCRQVRLGQAGGSTRVSDLLVQASAPKPLTEKEQAARTQASAQLIEYRREMARGNPTQAKQALAGAFAYAKDRYGDIHGATASLARAAAAMTKVPEHLDLVQSVYEQLAGRESEEFGGLLIQRGTLSTTEDESAEWCEKGLAILRGVLRREDPRFAGHLYDVGWHLCQRQLYDRAEATLREVAELRKETLGPDHPFYAGALNALALNYQHQGRAAEAKATFEAALAIFRRVEDRAFLTDRATVLTNLGFLLTDTSSDFATADQHLREALDIRRTLFGERSEPYYVTRNALGCCYRAWGRFPEAEAAFQEALGIAKALYGPQHDDLANILTNLARVRFAQDDFVKASEFIRQALEQRGFSELKPDERGQVPAERLRGLSPNSVRTVDLAADIAVQLADLPQTLLLFAFAKAYWEGVHGKQHPMYAATVANFATRLVTLRQPHLALALLQEDAAILEAACAAETPAAADTNLALGQVLHMTGGDLPAARRYIERSLMLRERRFGRQSSPYVAALNELGNVQQDQGEFDAAAKSFRDALDVALAIGGERSFNSLAILTNLGYVEHLRGRDEDAVRLLGRALDLRWQRLQLVAEAANEGQLLTLSGEFRGCLGSFVAAGISGSSDPAAAYAQVLRGKGLAFLHQRQRRLLRERPELAPLFGQLQETCRRMASLDSLDLSQPERAALLKEYGELVGRKQELEQDILAKSRTFRTETASGDLSVKAFCAALPADAALVDVLMFWQKGGTSGLESEPRLAAFVLRRDRPPQRIDLGPAQPIADAVEAWRREIVHGAGASPRGVVRDDAGAPTVAEPHVVLKGLVWTPLEPHLAGAKLVLFSPDGILAGCPLAALPGAEPGTYLIEQWPLVLCPVPQRLLEMTAAETVATPMRGAGQLLLVGDVRFDASPGVATPAADGEQIAQRAVRRQHDRLEFPPLPGTARELEQLVQLHGASRATGKPTVLRGAGATEDAVRRALAEARFIHVATHGYFSPDRNLWEMAGAGDFTGANANQAMMRWYARSYNPDLLSGLALAGANRAAEESADQATLDDGILTAAEVAACDLRRAQLVVLSACETGLGKNADGEGLLGLQRAFQMAGARSVVASLWQVEDDATQALMVEFYRNLWERKLPALDALRQAQLALLRGTLYRLPRSAAERSDNESTNKNQEVPLPPKFWAAFVLSGDWR